MTRSRATLAEEEVLVREDIKRVKVCRMETVCKMRFKEGHAYRTRIRNLVQPLLYDDAPEVSEAFVTHVRQALENLQDKQNVVDQVHRLYRQRAADRAGTRASTATTWRSRRRARTARRWRCRTRSSCRRM